MNDILTVRDLSVHFRQGKRLVQLVDRVSFSVARGECLGILGESGSGKSMTCKALLGLLDDNFQVTGSSRFEGKPLLSQTPEQLRRLRGGKISMVLQNPMSCFDPLYRIGEQMAETLQEHTALKGRPLQKRMEDILRLMRIHDPADVLRKYPHQLSGGMLQRVMIGLAICMQPSLIIADEPTTAIDSISQYAIMQEFLRIKQRGEVSMIFISHDLGVLSLIADRLIVMHDGKAVESGTAKENQKSLFGRERQQVLRGISLSLREGECLGIIGESGSGKSTLGRVLSGLLKPERGTVRINGLDLYARRSAREAAALHHSLSVVFQDYTSSANPRFRVEHIIGESLRALERSTGQRVDRRARICELLEQVGLPAAFISRYPHELSGGQLQRVCIARALAIRPRIILLDEAISSLDASTQVQIMDLLIELRRDLGLSYLFITHDLTSITYLCDRVVFIDAGTIVEQVDDIRCIAMIRNDYARNLLGSVMGIGVEHGSGAARTGQDRYAAIA